MENVWQEENRMFAKKDHVSINVSSNKKRWVRSGGWGGGGVHHFLKSIKVHHFPESGTSNHQITSGSSSRPTSRTICRT
ncbi:hypothetical protein MHYP_G00014250 [Metynnis hypsauchen]